MNKKFWTELWYFLLMLMGGLILILLLSFSLAFVYSQEDQPVYYLHIIQWLQTLFLEIIPVMIWCRWHLKDSEFKLLRIQNTASWKMYAGVIIVSLLTLPLLDMLAEACQAIPLPEALAKMAEEEAATQEKLIGQMISVDGFGGWLELILLMSVATAVGEELAFRGALLTIFQRYSKCNKHVTAILIGLIFSLIHFDFYGLIPRWILGTIFVYLVYYSGCIWPSVLAHALNNLYALLEYKGVW